MEDQNKQVSMNDFSLISVIGKGAYGKVLLVRKEDTQELFAMKILKK
jgi:serine/threonine protein kinase